MARILTHDEAKAVYDRFGRRQDRQAFYEDPARRALLRHAEFGKARALFEFGCGTGRFAATLLARHLPPQARYVGADSSRTMAGLAKARLAPWKGRALVVRTDGSMRVPAASGAFDRFVSSYVLDLLSEEDIGALLSEAHRVLAPGGLLSLVALTEGATPLSRLVTALWKKVHGRWPEWVGGCRPLELTAFVAPPFWRIVHRSVVTAFALSSEVLVALRATGEERSATLRPRAQ